MQKKRICMLVHKTRAYLITSQQEVQRTFFSTCCLTFICECVTCQLSAASLTKDPPTSANIGHSFPSIRVRQVPTDEDSSRILFVIIRIFLLPLSLLSKMKSQGNVSRVGNGHSKKQLSIDPSDFFVSLVKKKKLLQRNCSPIFLLRHISVSIDAGFHHPSHPPPRGWLTKKRKKSANGQWTTLQVGRNDRAK